MSQQRQYLFCRKVNQSEIDNNQSAHYEEPCCQISSENISHHNLKSLIFSTQGHTGIALSLSLCLRDISIKDENIFEGSGFVPGKKLDYFYQISNLVKSNSIEHVSVFSSKLFGWISFISFHDQKQTLPSSSQIFFTQLNFNQIWN